MCVINVVAVEAVAAVDRIPWAVAQGAAGAAAGRIRQDPGQIYSTARPALHFRPVSPDYRE